jgi:hypothetical protein
MELRGVGYCRLRGLGGRRSLPRGLGILLRLLRRRRGLRKEGRNWKCGEDQETHGFS